MAAIAFDTLKAARRLKEAGVPEAAAEAHAEIMAEAFVFNMDTLVTQDYLDARFAEHDARMDQKLGALEARIDQKLGSLETSMDQKLGTLETSMDQKLGTLETSMDRKLGTLETSMDRKLGSLESHINEELAEVRGDVKVLKWMLAAIALSTFIPFLRDVFSLI